MNSELLEALNVLEKEKNISKDTLLEAIEQSLLQACKNHFGKADNVKVFIDPVTCEFNVHAEKTVVEKVEDPIMEISLENAKQLTEKLQESWKRIYGQTEPELRVKLFEKGWQKKKGISRESTKTATALIHLCPDGVFS